MLVEKIFRPTKGYGSAWPSRPSDYALQYWYLNCLMGSFSRSLRQYYEAKVLSEAGIFCLIVWYLIIAVPFYLSFSTQSM